MLYLWQEAYISLHDGEPFFLLQNDRMVPWLQEFPLLRELSILEAEQRFLDRRKEGYPNKFGIHFTRADNELFCRRLIESSESFRRRMDRVRAELRPQTCVVNVRRGDYYTVPEFTARYALDIEGHVGEALELVRGSGRSTDDVLVISDDVAWCRENLTRVAGKFRTLSRREDMFDDLAALATAPTLVLANSTFSYWGHISPRLSHPE
ncbi:alpha-1,2-fucosyltransferase [Brachybacterium sp. EF45031]|uniref:alpha-1,2-fucosyltransferase n=1 Tax=Brachybacterium sillae TaxID=2810536 RepID=UPI00217E2D8D|nr:alpha-1,2-fucosyltransferase [Brachybacterium sillae]MCS6711619.1 alpha-1,2-fucosyltransferase [Brachybacterium sillae]